MGLKLNWTQISSHYWETHVHDWLLGISRIENGEMVTYTWEIYGYNLHTRRLQTEPLKVWPYNNNLQEAKENCESTFKDYLQSCVNWYQKVLNELAD